MHGESLLTIPGKLSLLYKKMVSKNTYCTGKLGAFFFSPQEKRLSSICITEALVAECHSGREYHI